MGKARIEVWLFASVLTAGVPAAPSLALAQSRFLSYLSETECTAGRVLSAAVCRSAFANARAEFEAKTPAFSSLTKCATAFRSCAAWPPGAKLHTVYRPQWTGVDIVDTPREKSVTPARITAGPKLSFAPRSLTGPAPEPRELVVRGARPAAVARFGASQRGAAPIQRAAHASVPERALGPSPPPPPGSGFKLEDGVLTYPAPARFAPKNLPKPP